MSKRIEQTISLDKFQKSRASGSTNTCVEVAKTQDGIYVRDSKNSDSPILSYTFNEWAAFIIGVHNNEFDIPVDQISDPTLRMQYEQKTTKQVRARASSTKQLTSVR